MKAQWVTDCFGTLLSAAKFLEMFLADAEYGISYATSVGKQDPGAQSLIPALNAVLATSLRVITSTCAATRL